MIPEFTFRYIYYSPDAHWLQVSANFNSVNIFPNILPGGGGGGGTQMLFGRGCAAEASKPVPIFKGHFGGKGYPLLGVWRKRVPIIRDF